MSWRRLNVQVMPSAEMVGRALAPEGRSFQSYNLLRKTSRGRRIAPVPSSTSIALFPEVRGESAPAMDFATSRWHRYSTVILGPRPPWGQAPEGFGEPGPGARLRGHGMIGR